MLRFLICLGFLASTSYAADHDMFRNCSRIPFCAKFRHQTLNSSAQYAANISDFHRSFNTVIVPLSNPNGDKLNLEITLLTGNKARVKILEPNSTRYQLSVVLDGDPVELNYSAIYNGDNLILAPDRQNLGNFTVVVNKGPPFTIEFYYESVLETVLNGDRLVMENTNTSKAFSFGIEYEGASKLYGLFHHAYKLALGETADGSSDPFRLRNADTDFYEVNSPMALYGSIPVLYGHSANWTSGVFLHNAAEVWVDISYTGRRPSGYFMVESGTLDLFVLLGPNPREVVRQYTNLTGTAHMPQIWVLGYHQCRWSYYTQEDAKNVVANMDKNDFPMDVLWLDDGHTNQYRYFEWNPVNFSNPIELQRNISSTGRKIVTILDPHIKIADDYAVYTGAKGKYFVKWANGSDFEGICWPGEASYIDFLNPEANAYYASWYHYNRFNGSTETLGGAWNDMNEPSVFDDDLEKTLPFEVLHYGNVPHRDVHNIYGFMQTRSTHQGLFDRDNGTKRPFVLTRSHFAGSQRYAAMWTGDNTADWPYLAISYSECMTSNILGQVLCGADVAGFFEMPSDELMQRWYQAAVWLPFFRGHSNRETPRREPYLFPDDVQAVLRSALKLRYKHIPVFYTLFFQHVLYGDPISRPLFYHYPELLEYDDHILVGSDILARPVMESNVSHVNVTIPGGANVYWYRVDDNSWSTHAGGSVETVAVNITVSPLYYRAGSIIPRLDVERPSTSAMLNDSYTLYVNLDQNNTAEGYLYVDDFTSFAYANNNSYFYVRMEYVPGFNGVQFYQPSGNSNGIVVNFQRIVLHRLESIEENSIVSTSYATANDGTPLIEIDVVSELQLNKQKNGYKLYL